MVLDPEVRFVGYGHADWQRLLELLRAVVSPSGDAVEGRRGAQSSLVQDGLIAVRRGDELMKLVHTRSGRVPVGAQDRALVGETRALAQHHGARWAMRLDAGALERVMDRLGREARSEDGLGHQLAALLEGWQAELAQGNIDFAWSEPPASWLADGLLGWVRSAAPGSLVPPLVRVARWAADRVCPASRTAFFAAFHGSQLWTCVIIRRGEQGVRAVLGPETVRRRLGSLSGHLEADHRALCRAIESPVEELHAACSVRYSALPSSANDHRWRGWRDALAKGGVVIDPRPPALAAPLVVSTSLAKLAAWAAEGRQAARG